MKVTQIFDLVNGLGEQALGNSGITLIDNTSVIALGNSILSSTTNVENFMNTLIDRIGKTIFSDRAYSSKFSDLMVDDMEWGAIMQKISMALIKAKEDPMYDLKDGVAIDMQTVSKPDVKQSLFTTNTPYLFEISIAQVQLETAFTSGSALGSFISLIYTQVQNSIELAFEVMARDCVCNMIACISDDSNRTINLGTLFNEKNGTEYTPVQLLDNEMFLRFAVGRINLMTKYFTEMSTLYNDGSVERHTPKDLQRMYVITEFESILETVVQYKAFNVGYVTLKKYNDVAFWQSQEEPYKVAVTNEKGTFNLDWVVGILSDTQAYGIYKDREYIRTAPFNSKGMYQNTHYHFNRLYFNDLTENAVIFTLN